MGAASAERRQGVASHSGRAGGVKVKAGDTPSLQGQITSGLQPVMGRPAMATIDAGRAGGRSSQYAHGRVNQTGNGSKNLELRNQHMQTSGSNVKHLGGDYIASTNMNKQANMMELISGGFVSSSQEMQLRAPAERQMTQGSRFSRGLIKEGPGFNNQ